MAKLNIPTASSTVNTDFNLSLNYNDSVSFIKNYFNSEDPNALNIKAFCNLNKINYRSVLTALNTSISSKNYYSKTILLLLSKILDTEVELKIERVYSIKVNKNLASLFSNEKKNFTILQNSPKKKHNGITKKNASTTQRRGPDKSKRPKT